MRFDGNDFNVKRSKSKVSVSTFSTYQKKDMKFNNDTVYNFESDTGILKLDIDPKILEPYLFANKQGPYNVLITLYDQRKEDFQNVRVIKRTNDEKFRVIGIENYEKKSYFKDLFSRIFRV